MKIDTVFIMVLGFTLGWFLYLYKQDEREITLLKDQLQREQLDWSKLHHDAMKLQYMNCKCHCFEKGDNK